MEKCIYVRIFTCLWLLHLVDILLVPLTVSQGLLSTLVTVLFCYYLFVAANIPFLPLSTKRRLSNPLRGSQLSLENLISYNWLCLWLLN